MAFKIYTENNHIVVQNLISNKEFRASKKDALIYKDRISEQTYNTKGFEPEGLQGINFSEIIDVNGNPFVNEQAFIDFYTQNTGNFNTAGATAQILYDSLGNNTDGSITQNAITNILAQRDIVVVDNYSTLPDPTTVLGKFYWVSNSQGTSWLPGILGGTFYNSGIYYSNGTTWEYIKTPYQATQSEVNAGTNNDKFITSLTYTTNIVQRFIDFASSKYLDATSSIQNQIDNIRNSVPILYTSLGQETNGSPTNKIVDDTLALKQSFATVVFSDVITFEDLHEFGTRTNPRTGVLSFNFTNAKKGIVQKVYHNSGTIPTVFTGNYKQGGIYTTSSLNIIYFVWCGGTNVEYWISKDL